MSAYPAPSERPSRIWIRRLSITFGASLVLLGGGIVALPLDWALRGSLVVGLVVMAWSSFMFAGVVLRPVQGHWTAQPIPSARHHFHPR